MGTEVKPVMADGVSFPPQITISNPLSLIANGITDIEIHFLQIKFTAIGVYLDPKSIVSHLQNWKGKTATELQQDNKFFDAIVAAPLEKLVRVVVIKEIKGSQYASQLETAVRDRLAEEDKFEEEEEEALEKIVQFFQHIYLRKDSVITIYFDGFSTAQIGFLGEGKEEVKLEVKNGNVVEMIQKWYLGGSRGVSPTTISSLASALSAELLK
ncbi:probable chalcone--flavanone isomerase 3 [Andrographis paniculata]|uniref:probable chalcone--flavanone isomerase 3 n=1 Tax=Andrographis paniculata TaxID=175694 RepID=UPI0021E7696A|nr:probable chalcone--flavanone isomerase 3 [Andrographis paniculata]